MEQIAKSGGMADDGAGVLKSPFDPAGVIHGAFIPENTSIIVKRLQDEMTEEQRANLQGVQLSTGEGMNIALGVGMMTAPLNQQIAFRNIFASPYQ